MEISLKVETAATLFLGKAPLLLFEQETGESQFLS
jgi:hypothetical protein